MSTDEQNSENTNDSGEQTGPAGASAPPEKVQGDSGEKNKPVTKSRGWGKALFLLILIATAFSGGGYLAYYYLDQEFSRIAHQQSTQIEELSDSIDSLQQADQGLLNNQRNLQGAINSVVSDTEDQLLSLSDRLSQSEAGGNDDWTLAEAEYLLRIANQRLVTSGDRESAIEMMQAADSILRELAYPELAPVRRQLANDLTKVQMANSLDVEGIYFELEALTEQVFNLEHYEPEPLSTNIIESEATSDLGKRLWNNIKSVLSRYIRIDGGAEPRYLLTQEQQILQTLSVQLQIRQAQLALLSEQQDVYTRALTMAANAIEQFYMESGASNATRARLHELADVQLQTENLDVSESIRELSSVVNQLSRMGVE